MTMTEEVLLKNSESNLVKDFRERKELICFFLGDATLNYKRDLYKEIDNIFRHFLIDVVEKRKEFLN